MHQYLEVLNLMNTPWQIDFVNAVAEIAEEAFHHPDIFISYTNVKLTPYNS